MHVGTGQSKFVNSIYFISSQTFGERDGQSEREAETLLNILYSRNSLVTVIIRVSPCYTAFYVAQRGRAKKNSQH